VGKKGLNVGECGRMWGDVAGWVGRGGNDDGILSIKSLT